MGDLETCALCPRLCRTACPVVAGVGREAAVPTLIAAAVYAVDTQQQPIELAKAALGLCVDCGSCEKYCHIGQPLPALLRSARLRFDCSNPILALPGIDGEAELVAIETDERRWSEYLSLRLGEPVARWCVEDGLGPHLIGTSYWPSRKMTISERLHNRRAVVGDGAAAAVLKESGVSFVWLHDLVPSLTSGIGSCRVGENPYTDGCCGGGGPLRSVHPVDARRMGIRAAACVPGLDVDDSRCATHLEWCGETRTDAITRLIRDSK